MSNLLDSQRLDSVGGAFTDEIERRDSFIPTSISKDEAPTPRIPQGLLSTNEIDKMVRELAERVMIEIHDSESTVSARDYLTHSRHAFDTEVEEIGQNFEVLDRDSEEEREVEGSETDSVETTFLKQAATFRRKPKVGTATMSLIILQTRKSDAVPTQAADSSKKEHKAHQDKGKKVMIDHTVRARDAMALQEKFVSDESVSKIYWIPIEDLMTRSAELASQFMAIGVEMADAFRAMSPTETQGLRGNIFSEDAENANIDEVADGVVSKVVDDPTTLVAYFFNFFCIAELTFQAVHGHSNLVF
uniref:Uncharacterized protein n=1 Tax=Cannabis sativa TaxID=3483 RepID=A0A803Q220_CANSA